MQGPASAVVASGVAEPRRAPSGQSRPLAFDFTGQVALVTGAGAGIGRAVAARLAQAGATVVAYDRDEAAAAAVAAVLANGATSIAGDISCWDRVHAQLRGVAMRFGRLDVVANVAGIYPSVPIADMVEAQWDLVMDVNLKGAFAVARAAMLTMRPQRSGAIVLIASSDAWRPKPRVAHYAAAKAGVVSLVRSLALEVAADGIRVNAVAPGPVATETALAGTWAAEAARANPMGRMAYPEEIADAVMFLGSPFATFITGETLSVNGGNHMR